MTMDGIGLQGKDIVKALARASKDTNSVVRRVALFALAKIEMDNPDIYTILGEALGDKEQNIRTAALSILVSMGKEATDTLTRATEDPRAAPRLLAMQALASLGEDLDEKGGLALRKGLGDEDPRIRQTAAQALGNVGPKARQFGEGKEMFMALANLLKDKDAAVRRAAVLPMALGKIGSEDVDEGREAGWVA